jgi:hypothetical protein
MKEKTANARSFDRLLRRLLAVPHSEIQYKLKAEKKRRKVTRKRTSRDSASA